MRHRVLNGYKRTSMLPVLGPDAWVDDPIKIADFLFTHYILSQHSQNELYPDMVCSLPYDVYKNSGDTGATARAVEQSLLQLFVDHFDNINISVSDVSPPNSSKQAISIIVEYSKNGIQYNLSRDLETVDSVLKKVIDINNGTTNTY